MFYRKITEPMCVCTCRDFFSYFVSEKKVIEDYCYTLQIIIVFIDALTLPDLIKFYFWGKLYVCIIFTFIVD